MSTAIRTSSNGSNTSNRKRAASPSTSQNLPPSLRLRHLWPVADQIEWMRRRTEEEQREAARRAALTAKPDPYRAFQEQYRDSPWGFVLDCVHFPKGQGPTDYQLELLHDLIVYRRISFRGPHGIGKTAFDAWVIHWFALTRDGEDWKLPTTASAWRQLTKFLWPEVHKWARSLRWDIIGRAPYDDRTELLKLSLKLRTGEAFAGAASDPGTMEGAHADSILYLYDEAKIIPAELFDASEGAFSGAGEDTPREAFAIANSTPGETQGRFYDIHRRAPGYEDWHVRKVTKEEAIAAGRMSGAWAEQRKRQWGEGSAVYQNRVEGEFAASDADGVIPLAWVEAANERWREWDDAGRPGTEHLTAVGVDVSDTGDAQTVLAPRYGDVVGPLRYTAKEETMETAGRVAGVLTAHPEGRAVVDVIGIGAGVVSRLRELFPASGRIEAFNSAEHSDAMDRSGELGFANRRAEAWWGLRERLDPSYGATLALPPDDRLTGDLTAPRYKVLSGGKILIESKEQIEKRIGRSTDAGDAVAFAFARPKGVPHAGAVAAPRPIVKKIATGYRPMG